MLQVDMELLKKAANDFYNTSKIKIVLYDKNRTIVYTSMEPMQDFCTLVRTNPVLTRRCLECDEKGFDICDRTKEIAIYKCHMNLSEAISPIFENGVIIGYMMLGQILDENSRETALKTAEATAYKYNLDKEALVKALKTVRIADSETIMSAANTMEMCVCFLWQKKIIKFKTDSMIYHLNSYIEEHLSEALSISGLCRHLNISRSSLYTLSKTNFGIGISDYIREKRIEKAIILLKEKNYRISEIAALVGIPDQNYFTKLIKKKTGKTPTGIKT